MQLGNSYYCPLSDELSSNALDGKPTVLGVTAYALYGLSQVLLFLPGQLSVIKKRDIVVDY